MKKLMILMAMLAGPALAGQTEGRPWTICIPVTTQMAAMWAAANPSDPFPLARPDYAPLRDTATAWDIARDHGSRGWIEGGTATRPPHPHPHPHPHPQPQPVPPIPLPASVWMLLAGLMALAGAVTIRRLG